jgi:hypothetical protein
MGIYKKGDIDHEIVRKNELMSLKCISPVENQHNNKGRECSS